MSTLGIHHLGLAVSDLEASSKFFTDALGWSVVREVPEYPARFVSNGEAFFTLWQTEAGSLPFDRKKHVGLHHVAIKIENEADMESLYQKVSGFAGVEVDFSPELLRGGPAKHFMIFEPSGIRIEFIWVP